MPLPVSEIYRSIQGESTYAGWPCVFIRLAGCNLHCTWCDTPHARGEGEPLSIPEIIERVRAFNCRMVEITGGEPLIHEKTPDLVNALVDLGHVVLLETNGSLDISRVNPRCIRIVDFKCPSSGEAESNRFENMEAMFEHDEIKFVVADREDYEYALDIIQHLLGDLRLSNTIHLSPVFGKLDPAELASWILEDRLGVRLSLQLHKYIWHPDQRGV